ncbi:caspase family protein [Maribacter chungangensis]|uniref:Caspase family protein n=1 Tax=Maribacter chungangensis TaxID=1069117 RepID=A0ABW3B247_9FLAO
MKRLVLLTFFFLTSNSSFAEKYGLIIAVGDYQERTGWSKISSANDVPLIKGALMKQDFKAENIVILEDAVATRAGILAAIKDLQARIQPGDVVVIHYSGHGQQMFDDNGEEIDDLDESIVPYDALVEYLPNRYEGQNHIRDDELGNIIADFRNKLGKNGQLLFMLDSCHSGSASRGGKARGGKGYFAPKDWKPSSNTKMSNSGLLEIVKVKEDASPFVMFTGASADQLNYEYEGYGSLSFAFSKSMNELGSDFTYRKLFSAISANMNVIAPNQTPTIEGDADYKLFKGEYVKQQPYFEINKISRQDVIKVNAGKLQRLFEGTTVNILLAGTSKVDETDIVTTGVISKVTFTEAIIKLDSPLKSANEKAYWVFVDTPSYGDINLNLYFDNELKSDDIKNHLSNFLEDKKLGQVVNDSLIANLIVTQEKKTNNFLLSTTNGEAIIYTNDIDIYELEDLELAIFNYAQGSYLKSLKLDNLAYEFEFRLLPAKYNSEDKIEIIDEDSFTNEVGKFQVDTDTDHVFLEVTNRSDTPLYFSIIEINSKGEIVPFMPSPDGPNGCNLNDNERLIPAGQTKIIKSCVYNFGPPYETLILKGFATPSPINFAPTVKSRGARIGTRGSDKPNPLESFLGQTYKQSRGSSGSSVSDAVDGYSTEFVYEIIKKK